MTHYWIQTWQGLCVYYITRHQAHLSFITYIPPPHQEREKGEWEGKRKGNVDLDPSYRQRLLFPSGQAYTLHLVCHHTVFFLPLFSSSFSSLLSAPIKYNNTSVHHGTPKTILPTGIFGEILETHQRGHSTLLPSHIDGTVRVDLGIIISGGVWLVGIFLSMHSKLWVTTSGYLY